MLKLDYWKVNTEIAWNSVPPYLSKHSKFMVKCQKEWLDGIVQTLNEVIKFQEMCLCVIKSAKTVVQHAKNLK